MANITSFTIDKKDLIAGASTRSFTVLGDVGAEFELQVFATPASSSVAQFQNWYFWRVHVRK